MSRSGETVAIIGANGAGKSTLLARDRWPGARDQRLDHVPRQRLGSVSAHRRVGLGISLVPEGRRLFPSLTVQENLMIGGHRSANGQWNLDSVLELFP